MRLPSEAAKKLLDTVDEVSRCAGGPVPWTLITELQEQLALPGPIIGFLPCASCSGYGDHTRRQECTDCLGAGSYIMLGRKNVDIEY